jgi:hypothetical protein
MLTWIYHKTEQPRIINQSDYPSHKESGWLDSPASFLNQADFGIDREKMLDGDSQEALKAQQVFDSINGVKDYCNGVLNLDSMTKKQLFDFAKKHLKIELNLNATKAKLLEKIRGKIGGDS